MNVVLDERAYVEDILDQCTLEPRPLETLGRIARYYASFNYKKSEIRRMLEAFMLKCDPNINIVKWQNTIDKLVRDASKYQLINIENVPITQRELDICNGLDGKQMRRLMFTLICLAKYGNMMNVDNDGWVNKQDKDIFKMANVVTSTKRQSLMLNDLRSLGLVRFSRKVDNININVRCIDNDGDAVLSITDFRNLGYQYQRYCGEPYFECCQCGLVIKRTSNVQKYCHDCAVEINRQKTCDAWRAENEREKAAM